MHERFFGIGEPLIQRERDQGIDAAAYLDLVKGLGCSAYRSWMHLTELLFDPDTPDPEEVRRHTRLLDRAAELPYVRTLHNFRLLNENAMLKRGGIEENRIGGLAEVYFGIFTDPEDGCRPRARAYAIQKMTGSGTDLEALGKRLTETK